MSWSLSSGHDGPVGQSAIDVVVDHPAFSGLPYWHVMAELGVPPHVSLLFPWRETPVTADDLEEVSSAIKTIRAFAIRFGGVAVFPNGTVYAAVEPSEQLSSLLRRIWGAFPETPPYGGEFGAPQPHLTLAKCAPADAPTVAAQLEERLRPILPLDLRVSAITVLEQQPDDTWRVAGRIGLDAETMQGSGGACAGA